MTQPPLRFEDYLQTEGLPAPWDCLERSICLQDEFAVSSRKCAEFFKNHAPYFSASELIQRLLRAKPQQKWLEYFLVSLLDTSVSYLQLAKQALRLKNLRRLIMRIETGCRISKNEFMLSRQLKGKIALKTTTDVLGCAYFARKLLAMLIGKRYLHETHRWLLVFLIRSEISAFKERIERLSKTIDVYNLRKMAKILPKMESYDRIVQQTLEVADAIEKQKEFPRPTMTIETVLDRYTLGEILKSLASSKESAILYSLISLQTKKRIPTKSLVALASLSRWVLEANHLESNPFTWLYGALSIYKNGKFSIDAGAAIEQLRPFAESSGASINGTVISGDFSDRLYSTWIGRDNLSRQFEPEKKFEFALTLKDLINANINNETLICRLLDNAKVYSCTGLVEYIATVSRSVGILSKIASLKHLHSGPANRGVPRALLLNPANIPIALLRPFIQPSYFNYNELRHLVEGGTNLRPEVFKEISAYLRQLSSTDYS